MCTIACSIRLLCWRPLVGRLDTKGNGSGMRLVGEQTRDRTRRPAASCAPSLAAGPALGVAEILALQRGAGNSPVSALLPRVQQPPLSLASEKPGGDPDSAPNRREDVQHVLDRLHVLWSIDNDTYAR